MERIALKKDDHGGFQLVGNAILIDPVPQNVTYLKEAIQKKKEPNRVTCDADEINMYILKEDGDWVPEDEETKVNRGKSKADCYGFVLPLADDASVACSNSIH